MLQSTLAVLISLFLEVNSAFEISDFPRLNEFLHKTNSVEMEESISDNPARVAYPFRFDLKKIIDNKFVDKMSEPGPAD
jgi:hypothetical protein